MLLYGKGKEMELIDKLREKFEDDSYRNIVFWYDSTGDRNIEELKIDVEKLNVKLWELKENNSFKTRCQLEVIDKENDYLIYSKLEKPNDRENPLIDILLYSKEFSADDVALIIDRYNLHHLNIRGFIKENIKFFNEKKRCKKLEDLLPETPMEDELELGMLCTLCGCSKLNIDTMIKTVLSKGLDEINNEALINIKKFFNINTFWKRVYAHFGVLSSEFSLETLFNTIVSNYFTDNITFDLPKNYKYIYETKLGNVCNIFYEDLIRENNKIEEIIERVNYLEASWDIYDILQNESYLSFYKCYAFKGIDKILILKVIEEINNETCSFNTWEEILEKRRLSIWNIDKNILNCYKVISIGLELYNQKMKFKSIYMPTTAYDWAKLYTKELYKIDMLYRRLIREYVEINRPEVLSELISNLSDWYNNLFMDKLSSRTDYILDNELSKSWHINKFDMQKDFYNEHVNPLINNTLEKVYVIVSDAFRYECAKDLEEVLNLRLNSEVQVKPMLGVVPSYTQLGMASLLPGRKISIDNSGTVYKDGISTKGLENRNKIINKYVENSVALSLQKLMEMKVDEGTSITNGKRLVYLYHDRIDAAGDSLKSEGYTYEVVNDAIKELKDAIAKLVGSYSATRIFVTSDHGFLYQSEKVDERYKAVAVQGDIYDSTRRFAIGSNLSVPEGAHKMDLGYLGIDTECVITTGLNRFKVKGGGLRFVHGGAMPQEVIVPVLCYKEVRGQKRKKEEKKVEVSVSNTSAITNHKHKIKFFQENKVNNEYLERNLKVAFYAGGERISNEVTLCFNSTDEAISRVKEVIFSIQEKSYNIGEPVNLKLIDVDKNNLYKEIEFEMKIYEMFV